MFIYQIGNVIIQGFAEHSTPVSWRGSITQPEQSNEIFFSNYYKLPEVSRLSINGTIKCFKDVTPITQLEKLMRIGGIPYIDIIGYTPNTCCRPGIPCGICGGSSFGTPVNWWQTYGMIRSVNRNYSLDVDHNEQLVALGINLEVDANPLWRPLNRYMWFPYYADDEPDTFSLILEDASNPDDETDDDGQFSEIVNGLELYYHPPETALWHFQPQFKFYKKSFTNRYLLYNPDYWADFYDDIYAYGNSLSTYGASSSLSYTIENSWSGDIKTLHAFGNLPTSGLITITIQHELSPFNVVESVSEIDLADLTTAVSDPDVSLSPSVIYAGTDDIATSFGINGAYNALATFTSTGGLFVPAWTYSHRCPGELFGLKCQVTIEKPTTVTYGSLHLFRKL